MAKTKTKVVKTETTETKRIDLFTLVKHNGKIRICLGNTCIHSGEFETFEEAEKVIKAKDWELIINSVAFTISNHFNLQKQV